jgi:hypothetical protein
MARSHSSNNNANSGVMSETKRSTFELFGKSKIGALINGRVLRRSPLFKNTDANPSSNHPND